MDIGALITGGVAGAGTGFLAAVATPFAQRIAESQRDRIAQRRARVDAGRALVAEARREGSSSWEVAADPRFTELRPHLSKELRSQYSVPSGIRVPLAEARQTHDELLDEIDALEKKWKLV